MPKPQPLPGRTLRIGVTGARRLPERNLEHLRREVDHILREIDHRGAPDQDSATLRLELLSPLAEGADRLVADCALKAGYKLVCPLPFKRATYEEDFKGTASVTEFRALLSQAGDDVLELDGSRNDDIHAYEAVGRLVVRNCDLIIGIWDGRPGGGRGGTADIIRYAAASGPPVVWLHATEKRQAVWIEEVHDLDPGAEREPAAEKLPVFLSRLLRPPVPRHRHGSLMHGCAHAISEAVEATLRVFPRRRPPDPASVFLHERPHPVWLPWRLNAWFFAVMGWWPFAPRKRDDERPPERPREAETWAKRFATADLRAGEYAARYRSSYIWIFLFATMAIGAAAFDSPQWHAWALRAEVSALGLIVLLVVLDASLGWQRKAVSYRIVAELCRKQQALGPVGWVVPRSIAWATAAKAPKFDRWRPHVELVPWESWLFSAWLRDTPLLTGPIGPDRVRQARDAALYDLLDSQIDYHEKRGGQAHRAGWRMIRLGEACFLVVLGLVAYKFCPLWASTPKPWLDRMDMAIAILPAASAALVGIRAYAELEVLAEQSEMMLRRLRRAKLQLAEMDCEAPLASQTLGAALATVAMLMLEDLQGWARVFRSKVVEA